MQKVKNVWCPSCGHKGYKLDAEEHEIEGVKYKELIPYCPECNSWFLIDEIWSENIDRKRNAERKAWGRVSYEDLLRLPRRYGVPREMLNIILNLDNHEPFTSLWDGAVASEEESDRIKESLDPEGFMKYLEAAKDKIPSDKYSKIHKRVDSMARKARRGRMSQRNHSDFQGN